MQHHTHGAGERGGCAICVRASQPSRWLCSCSASRRAARRPLKAAVKRSAASAAPASCHSRVQPAGVPRKPEVHISLDHIKPRHWEALGVGLVLLANLPFSLRDKEAEKPTVRGQGRGGRGLAAGRPVIERVGDGAGM